MVLRSDASLDPDAVIATTALIDGDVTIGAGTCVMEGAKIVSHGSPVVIGRNCVIMENSVIRGAGIHACEIGNGVLIGPQAYVCGSQIEDGVFIGTGAVVLNGSLLRSGTVVQVHAVVHIDTVCVAETIVPIGFVASGSPARVMSAQDFANSGEDLGFTKTVFGFSTTNWSNRQATEEVCRRYTRYLSERLKDTR